MIELNTVYISQHEKRNENVDMFVDILSILLEARTMNPGETLGYY